MSNFYKTTKWVLKEYGLLGLKILLAFVVFAYQTIVAAFLYFVIDLLTSFIEKFKTDEKHDLSDQTSASILDTAQKTNDDLEKMALEQKEYYAKEVERKKSLDLLNRLLAESEIREKDLLSLTNTSSFYQIFVYSSSLGRLTRSLNIEDLKTQPNRKYPVFLKELGFARLGKASSCFLINKNNLKDKKLADIKKFKKFLMYHFSKIRDQEWQDFLTSLKDIDSEKAKSLEKIDFRSKGHLMINFLVTEANMNLTNIGLVDGEHLGLADVNNSEDVNRQMLIGSNISPNVDEESLKVRIKKVINKQDISILLPNVEVADKIKIESEQDAIKENLRIQSILEFSKITQTDLSRELITVGISAETASEISEKIIHKAEEYQTALDNLSIRIDV